MANVHFHTLGCRLNQAESERIARSFKLAGHTIVSSAKDADLQVINTCTVTKNAGDDSRKAAKPAHENQLIVVTGCHSQVHPEQFDKADLLVDNSQKENLAKLAMERFGMDGVAIGMENGQGADRIYPLALETTRAFVKIQDGCNHACTFCLTTIARGRAVTRSPEEIVSEIRSLTEQGCREVILTGVHAGSYKHNRKVDLGHLTALVLEQTDIQRLRYGSLEPWNFRRDWLHNWDRFGDRLCRHLHMSLQSGSSSVLRRMKRCYDAETFASRVDMIRESIPGMSITTDIIVGFPGETDEEHAESLALARRLSFAGAHIFPYSPRPGTPAADEGDQIDRDTKKTRFRDLKRVIAQSEREFREDQMGEEHLVLWENEVSDGVRSGLTDNFIRVFTDCSLAQLNHLGPARLLRDDGDRMWAEPVD